MNEDVSAGSTKGGLYGWVYSSSNIPANESEPPNVVCTKGLGVIYMLKCYDHVKALRIIAGHLHVGITYNGLYDKTVPLTWIQGGRMVREVNITWRTVPWPRAGALTPVWQPVPIYVLLFSSELWKYKITLEHWVKFYFWLSLKDQKFGFWTNGIVSKLVGTLLCKSEKV